MEINELHEKFSEYGKNAKDWQRKCILLLPEIAKLEVWKIKGFSCIYEYAAKLAGMSRGQVDDALYILKKIEDKPALMEIVELRGVNAVRPVVSIATKENEKFWAGKAKEMSNNTLRVFVKEVAAKKLEENINQQIRDIPKNENKIKTITMQLPEKLGIKLEKLKGDKGWEEIIKELVELKEMDNAKKIKKLEEEKPVAISEGSRHIPTSIKNYVVKRSGGKCEFPNCSKNYNHFHHTNRYASNKVHDPDKIIALCTAHHNLAHRGLIDHEETAAKNWKIRKDPDYKNLNWFVDEQIQLYRR